MNFLILFFAKSVFADLREKIIEHLNDPVLLNSIAGNVSYKLFTDSNQRTGCSDQLMLVGTAPYPPVSDIKKIIQICYWPDWKINPSDLKFQ